LRGVLSVGCRGFLLTTPPVEKRWAKPLRKSLRNAGYEMELLVMPDGERAKKLAELEKLAEKMMRRGADRQSFLIALGGGVVGDVGGFLASVFMRGIPVVQVPTTLLAQVDSAIGGKTGVNLAAGKNLLGTFHHPLAVLADPEVLATLPEREYRSGLFEAMKYGVIRNPAIFELMEREGEALLARRSGPLERLITECIRVKSEVVSGDEREGGERRILNFGHTVGHALEAETGYKHFLHGEAVAWGMIAAAMIGVKMKVTGETTARRIVDLVLSYGRLPKVKTDPKRVFRRLLADKKSVGGVPHFVLAREIGRVEIVSEVPPEYVIEAVKSIRGMCEE